VGVEEKSVYVVERMGESLFFGFVIRFTAPLGPSGGRVKMAVFNCEMPAEIFGTSGIFM
jgi:hypothetical protein